MSWLSDYLTNAGIKPGVDSLAAIGETPLLGDVTLSGGSNVTLTQIGQNIEVASTGGGGGGGGVTKLYDYEVAGADKASIDTFVDGTTAPNFAGYDVLEAFFYSRTDEAAALSQIAVIANNDASAVYDYEIWEGYNATVDAGAAVGATNWGLFVIGANAAANFFGFVHMTIPNYLGTVGYKVGEASIGWPDTSAGNNYSGKWTVGYRSLTGISRLKFTAPAAKKFKIGTRLIVYGQ